MSNNSLPAKLLQRLTGSDSAWLVFVVSVGAVLRFINITKSSVWHDEGYSLMLAPQSLGQIMLRTGRDVHPPLYYLSLHYWMKIFGTSELAIRSLSVVYMLLVIVITYALIKQLFGKPAARLASLFTALAPFLIRYSQEARMYGMLAFIVALATWLLVRAQQSGRWRDWIFYSLAVAAGLYTYYYVIFMIVFHWAYIALSAFWPRFNLASLRKSIFSTKWIAANALAFVLWLPWVPTAYVQLTKIQSPPWIPRATLNTLPSSFGQFMTFTDVGGNFYGIALAPIRNILFITFIILVLLFIWHSRKKPLPAILMTLYMGLTPLIVWLLSFGAHPKYIDRYFVFAAVAFYALLAVLITQGWPWKNRLRLQQFTIALTIGIFLIGLNNVWRQGNHMMRPLTDKIAVDYQPGDELIAGDFYTFFDFNYYATQRRFSSPVKAYVPNNFPGCCEGRSMLYDRPDLVLKNWHDLKPKSGYVWVVGRPGTGHDYFEQLPSNWQPAGQRIEMGSVATQRFLVIKTNPTLDAHNSDSNNPAIPPPTSGRLAIKDLGISIGIPTDIPDMQFNSQSNWADLTSLSLLKISQDCTSGLGGLSRVLKSDLITPEQASQTFGSWARTKKGLDDQVRAGYAKEFPMFYIHYVHPQASCTWRDGSANVLEINQLRIIKGIALTAELL